MVRTRRLHAIVTPLAAVAALALAGGAQAQVVKPFKVAGVGVGPQGLPLPGQPARSHWAVGEASHLGRYAGDGTLRTDTADLDLANGRITGQFEAATPFVFVGANGDKLVTWYGRTDHGASQPGSFELDIVGFTPGGDLIVQAQWVAEFVTVPSESTGKFAGVTGSWVMYAESLPFVLGSDDPVLYSWDGEGRLTFREGT